MCKCQEYFEKCEWFELGTYAICLGEEESYSIESFDTYKEAKKRKHELMLENPDKHYFIDGWISKPYPQPIWDDNE